MAQNPTEFTMEAVRQLMLANGGRVTNHELVKSFRRWLTDPAIKEQARVQFKDYVNALATIKQEDGEKYLVLKKKYFPDYYSDRPNQVQEFYTNNPEKIYESAQYGGGGYPVPAGGSGGYPASAGGGGGGSYPNSYTGGVPNHPTGNGSPSLLDEVMAGFSPQSRTLMRPTSTGQVTSPPASMGYHATNGPASYHVQSPVHSNSQQSSISNIPNYMHEQRNQQSTDQKQSSVSSTGSDRYLSQDRPGLQDARYDRQMSNSDKRYDRQSSSDLLNSLQNAYDPRHNSQDLRYDRHNSQDHRYDRQHSQDLRYDGTYSQDLRYDRHNSQDLRYERQGSHDLKYEKQNSQDLRKLSKDGRSGYKDVEDDIYNPGAFSAHFVTSSRQSVASLTSHTSSGSYQESPRSSYARGSVSGSPRGSVSQGLPTSPLNSLPSQPTGYPGDPRLQSANPASPPYMGGSPRGGVAQPAPPYSYSGGSPRGSVTSQEPGGRKPESRAPPPYRPPPIEAAPPPPRPTPAVPGDPTYHQTRGMSSRPPPERPNRLDLVPPDLGLPPTPPRRIDVNPPPLPRRSNLPSTDSVPDSLGLPIHKNQKPLSDSISLSKSYGNLSVDENKENMRMESAHSVDNLESLNKESEVISVRERTKTFNRMASETEMLSITGSTSKLSMVKRRNSRAVEMGSRRGSAVSRDDESHDSASITTLDPTIKSWMIQISKGDYQTAHKMLSEEPKLARHKDFTTGYTGLHWACKYGNMDMVKLLAGAYHANVNAKSHGGYTPLHIAAQHGHQAVFDLLVQAYKADANIRDYSGKRPRQYMIQADSSTVSLSNHTFRQLKDRRRTRTSRMEKNHGMLRFGSLSVKVKKTTEAFNNYFNNNSSESPKRWNSSVDAEKMPPPKFAPIKKRKSKRTIDFSLSRSAPTTPSARSPVKEVIPEAEERASDSDSEFGFGNSWSNA